MRNFRARVFFPRTWSPCSSSSSSSSSSSKRPDRLWVSCQRKYIQISSEKNSQTTRTLSCTSARVGRGASRIFVAGFWRLSLLSTDLASLVVVALVFIFVLNMARRTSAVMFTLSKNTLKLAVEKKLAKLYVPWAALWREELGALV